jgi:hypothetical protein
MASAMTAPTYGTALRFISTATSSIVMVAIAPTVAEVAVVQQAKLKTAMVTVVQTTGLLMAIAMTAPTNGMALRFISTATNLIVMVAIAPTVAEAEIQLGLVALVKVVQPELKRNAQQQVVHILATIRHVAETHAAEVATVKQVGQKTAKALASLITSMKRGLVTPSVMMVHMSLLIMDVMNALQGLRSG